MKNKIIAFNFPEKMHAELKARLLYDGIPMTKFIRHYVESYLRKDSCVLSFIDDYKKKNKILNKKRREKNLKLIEKGKEIETMFNLSKEDVTEIYDILDDNLEIKI